METKRYFKRFSAALLACLLAVSMAAAASETALAVTKKTVSSVVIRVGVNIEAGDTLPTITRYDNSTDTHDDPAYVGTNSDKYEIRDVEWVTSENEYMGIGTRPKMRVYLQVSNSDDYSFKGSYGSSNVTVKGGSLNSVRKEDSDTLAIVVSVNGVKGQYPAPTYAEWRDSGYGRARWNYDEYYDEDDYTDAITSGYYDVYLYRGNSVVHKVEDYKGTSYNFYPYMTKKGTYYFKVRTVPHTEEQKQYGKKSEWTESDEIYIDEDHVSDGSGQVDVNGVTSSPTQVGWIQSGGTWYFRYPNGTYQSNGWLQLNGIWYLFDSSGRMLTGWQEWKGCWYYLQSSGAMLTGWIKGGNYWYYMNTLSDGGTEGAMRTGWLANGGKTYFLDSNGVMAEGWRLIDGKYYYFYPGFGYLATNTTIDNYFRVDASGAWVQ